MYITNVTLELNI